MSGNPRPFQDLEELQDGTIHNPNFPHQLRFREDATPRLPAGFVRFESNIAVDLMFVLPTTQPNLLGTPGGDADINELTQFVLDTGNGILYDNRSRICDIHASKSFGQRPRTVVTLRPL